MATQVKTFCIEDQVARLTQNILRPQSAWVSVVIRIQKVQLGGPSSTLGCGCGFWRPPCENNQRNKHAVFQQAPLYFIDKKFIN